jgi:hypothetical protein
MASPVTQTAPIAVPLAQIVCGVIGLAQSFIGLILTLNFFVIWTEKRPATAPLTNYFSNHIFCTERNISAGQIVTIPAKTTCANRTSLI